MMWDEQQLREAVARNTTIAGVIRDLAVAHAGPSYKRIHREVCRLGLDTTHWKGQRHGSSGVKRARPFSEVLAVDSPHRITGKRKARLIRDGTFPNICAICKMEPEWNGKTLVLRIDHINGVRNDNRIENLRLICPNCDSQTDTYCGRNTRLPVTTCAGCGTRIGRASTWCVRCSPRLGHPQPTKINWPPIDELQRRVAASSFIEVSHELGVSDNAIRKRIRNHSGAGSGNVQISVEPHEDA